MKERIGHNNYEAWLLDRLEGNLSPDQEQELDAFLALNPDLDVNDGALPALDPLDSDRPEFDKELLRRSLPPEGLVSSTSVDDHLIARLEGDLSPEQRLALEKFLFEHPEHSKAEKLYALTKLVPATMAFAEKQNLERQLPPIGIPTKYTIDDHLVARLEGDLTAEQESVLDVYLKDDPQARVAWTVLARTRIAAERIEYPGKSSLKKGGRVIAIGYQRLAVRLAAAASIAILVGLGVWTMVRPPASPEEVADAIVSKEDITPVAKDRGTDKMENDGASVRSVVPDKKAHKSNSPATPPKQDNKPVTNETHVALSPVVAHEEPTTLAVEADRIREIEGIELAEQRKVMPVSGELEYEPESVPLTSAPITMDEELAEVSSDPSRPNNVGGLVASTLRDKVLDHPSADTRPLDGDDAIAVVDKGLKAVGGENAGLSVERTSGKIRGFDLRLGRNFALTASTGR